MLFIPRVPTTARDKEQRGAGVGMGGMLLLLLPWIFLAGVGRSQPAADPSSFEPPPPTLTREPFIALPSGWDALVARMKNRQLRERNNPHTIFRMPGVELLSRMLENARAADRLYRNRRGEDPRALALALHEAAEQLVYRVAHYDAPLPHNAFFMVLRLETLGQSLVEFCEEKSYGNARVLARIFQRQAMELAELLPEDFLDAIPWQPKFLPQAEGIR
jgi:hypothetical protein